LHCEGSILITIFGLLFWEIIFDASVPMVFQSPYQTAPLDFWTEMFYRSRKQRIDERIALIAACETGGMLFSCLYLFLFVFPIF
jgi:Fanconi-associated nuclease 1